MKNCNKCKIKKDLDCFSRRSASIDGRKDICKDCSKVTDLIYSRSINGFVSKIFNHQISSSKKRGHKPPQYTKNELKDWITTRKNFKIIMDEWKENDYCPLYKPSIDRKDDYKGYCFKNIRLTTWNENNKKGHKDRFGCINTKVSKIVLQYSMDNVFIESFKSVASASRATGVGISSISRCALEEQKKAGGFIWKYPKNTAVV